LSFQKLNFQHTKNLARFAALDQMVGEQAVVKIHRWDIGRGGRFSIAGHFIQLLSTIPQFFILIILI